MNQPEPKHTLSDLAAIAKELAGMEGTIWCGPTCEVTADTAYNLAQSGHAFMFLPMRLVKNGDLSYQILVFNDLSGMSSCMSTNGPRLEFQRAIAELKQAVEKVNQLADKVKSDGRSEREKMREASGESGSTKLCPDKDRVLMATFPIANLKEIEEKRTMSMGDLSFLQNYQTYAAQQGGKGTIPPLV
jgi:hypothetical protein